MKKLLAQFRQYRAATKARLQLENELAAYSSPSDLAEIDAIIGRYSEEDTREVHEILSRVRQHAPQDQAFLR